MAPSTPVAPELVLAGKPLEMKMQTFNWFFGLEEDSEKKSESPPADPKQESAAHRAKTGVFVAPVVEQTPPKAETEATPAARPTADSAPTVKIPVANSDPAPAKSSPAAPARASGPATQVAYAGGAGAKPAMAVATKAALQGAQAQLHGAIPVHLHPKTPAAAASAKSASSAAGQSKLRQRLQTGALAVAAVAVLGAAVWSFLPNNPSPPQVIHRTSATAEMASRASPPLPPTPTAQPHRDIAVDCLKDVTETTNSAVRDKKLAEAIAAYDKGRVEQARDLFKAYSKLSCDRATLAAAERLERQISVRNRDR